MEHAKKVWTIGHSTRSQDEFLQLLSAFNIQILADIRAFPGSRKYPHFNQEVLVTVLPKHGIQYFHFAELGGRRKPKSDSHHTEWRNTSFRGYADYMDTTEFKDGVKRLEQLADERNLAYMCSEAVWWRCHRALVSDYLKMNGWTVLHIETQAKSQEHPYTTPVREKQGKLFPK